LLAFVSNLVIHPFVLAVDMSELVSMGVTIST